MRISRSTGYGILAIGYIAQHQKDGIILSQDIAQTYNIPLEYLLKILQQMVKANILRSKRGPRGGFSLAKPSKKITMLEIIEAVEGPMTSDLNIDDTVKGAKFCDKAGRVYAKAISQAKAVFSKATLDSIL